MKLGVSFDNLPAYDLKYDLKCFKGTLTQI